MLILSRYISKTILSGIFIVALVLMGLEVLFVFIGELNNIGTGSYTAMAALRYVLLDMPYQLNMLFPMAGLVGSLMGLGLLASQSELVVMRASGFSTSQISMSVLKAAAIALIAVVIIGEVCAPYLENMATTGQAIAKSNGQALPTKQGMWLRAKLPQGQNFIHVQKVLTQQHLLGITVYQFNAQHQLTDAFYAEKGDFEQGKWLLHNVKMTDLKGQDVKSNLLDTISWDIDLDPRILAIDDAEPRNMSLVELNRYIDYLGQNGLRATNYQLSFWLRVMQPFATAVMIILGVPFIFGPLRSVTMGLRLVTGISVGFCFYLLNQFFGPVSALYQLPPFLGAALPTLIFAALGGWLIWRTK
jgi:lipopolysaccharide export system permease protein